MSGMAGAIPRQGPDIGVGDASSQRGAAADETLTGAAGGGGDGRGRFGLGQRGGGTRVAAEATRAGGAADRGATLGESLRLAGLLGGGLPGQLLEHRQHLRGVGMFEIDDTDLGAALGPAIRLGWRKSPG